MSEHALDRLSIALWAVNLSQTLDDVAHWVDRVEAVLEEAAEAGVDLLLMPEYAAEQWLSFKPNGLAPQDEIGWMADRAEEAAGMLDGLASSYGVAFLPGTMPRRTETGTFRNRASLFLPDGRRVDQDKLCLTPFEKDPESWSLEAGRSLSVTSWRGLRIATLVCLDVELPALAARLAPMRPDLILVPSMTEGFSGQARVFGCARARAIELMSVVAVTGVVGVSPGSTQNLDNVGGAAVFVPAEPDLGDDGVIVDTGPIEGDADDGPRLVIDDIPIDTIRDLRAGRAQVWPGVWSADHIEIEEPS